MNEIESAPHNQIPWDRVEWSCRRISDFFYEVRADLGASHNKDKFSVASMERRNGDEWKGILFAVHWIKSQRRLAWTFGVY